mmetsp:Transcript_20900/g.18532  ORF Transcript_20900/g.18532 Transcript_20900/m.18532 type:complete len:182 (+) Transcript_20900:100-645(+)
MSRNLQNLEKNFKKFCNKKITSKVKFDRHSIANNGTLHLKDSLSKPSSISTRRRMNYQLPHLQGLTNIKETSRKITHSRSISKESKFYSERSNLIKGLPKLFQIQPSRKRRIKLSVRSSLRSKNKLNTSLIEEDTNLFPGSNNNSFIQSDSQNKSFNDFKVRDLIKSVSKERGEELKLFED